ncbi:hypothetical protein [Nonomuraea sp. NPDC050691]|uniref:hypothetical protein n=1 Tax=Nonomuraea sp. NPDC050691 TaxID=3155661 RepID=UPI0033D85C1D
MKFRLNERGSLWANIASSAIAMSAAGPGTLVSTGIWSLRHSRMSRPRRSKVTTFGDANGFEGVDLPGEILSGDWPTCLCRRVRPRCGCDNRCPIVGTQ